MGGDGHGWGLRPMRRISASYVSSAPRGHKIRLVFALSCARTLGSHVRLPSGALEFLDGDDEIAPDADMPLGVSSLLQPPLSHSRKHATSLRTSPRRRRAGNTHWTRIFNFNKMHANTHSNF